VKNSKLEDLLNTLEALAGQHSSEQAAVSTLETSANEAPPFLRHSR
jgi:hypothetical protein